MKYKPIENYGIIGDLQTTALVGMDGSIDFMCFPNFDSPSIFAALLDHNLGGKFQITSTMEEPKRHQMYLPDTNILLTRFLCEKSVGEVSDYMVIDNETHHQALVRRAKAVRGRVNFQIICDPRFDYGRQEHTVKINDGEVIFSPNRDDLPTLRLITNIPLKKHNGNVRAEFFLSAGESAHFILEKVDPDKPSPCKQEHYATQSFKDTMNFWRTWISKSNYQGRWREIVNRSALTLKLLTSKIHGSIVASATFGLPEEIGGERNWDYRFTWIRDASFTLYGLIRLGFTDSAAHFMQWIEARCSELAEDGSLQIMYGVDGKHHLKEEILPHFEGYRGSSPVRIGNEAYQQLQLDIYGELMDSVYLFNKYGNPISIDLWKNLIRLINWVCDNWKRKDEGIWEVRGGPQEFLYSRLMCWVAVDRAIRLAMKRSFPGPLVRWGQVRNEIYEEILNHFWNPKLQAFVQHAGSVTIDASCLLMPLMKFISPVDPRWLSTLEAVTKTLVDDSLVYRYKVAEAADDGLKGNEGTFNMCSFWYVECLSRAGDLQQARFIFEKMLGYANHLGLYSEELGPSGEQLGNFPQAFTHLGLISAAFNLDQNLSRKTGL